VQLLLIGCAMLLWMIGLNGRVENGMVYGLFERCVCRAWSIMRAVSWRRHQIVGCACLAQLVRAPH
jgi:hypothetical protein